MTKTPKSRWICAAVLATCVAVTTTAVAGPDHDHHGKQRMARDGDASSMMLRHLHHGVEQLDLDEAQRAAVDAVFADAKADLKANHLATREAREALHDTLMADSLDEDALALAAKAEGDLVAERIVIAGTAMSRVKAELTEDQLAELQARADRFREHARLKREARHESRRAAN